MYSSLLVLLLTANAAPAQVLDEPSPAEAAVPSEASDAAPPAPPVPSEASDSAPPAPAAPPPPSAPAPDVVLLWNETTLQAIKSARTPPPMAARNLAMVHAAIYDVLNTITPTHQPYRTTVTRPPGEVCRRTAAAIAAHRVLVSLYPAQVERFDAALDESVAGVAAGAKKTAGMQLGQSVAEQMLAWRQADRSNQPIAFTPRLAIGSWRPTPPGYQAGLLPHWSRVTLFAMTDRSRFEPPPPPPLNSVEYTHDFNEVKLLGRYNSRVRTADQTAIAFFWEDGEGTVTPPGRWNRIAQVVARQRQTTLEENARLFALLNISLADAAIVCWECKFKYAFWRPVHAIQEADRDGNPATEPDPEWMPLLTTPPFPSYTSGHSSFSGAGAQALIRFFGSDAVPFNLTSEGLPGLTRSYAGFWQAAEEAGRSRIYGGIHYDFDNRFGLATGRSLADWIAGTILQPLGSVPQGQVSEKRLVPIPANQPAAVQSPALQQMLLRSQQPASSGADDDQAADRPRRYSLLQAEP